MIDTHCHLTFNEFSGETDRLLREAREVGVRGAITVSTTSEDAQAALDLARHHDGLWCSAGVHPLYSDQPIDWDAIRRIGEAESCLAWGELGLDNHYDRPPRNIQIAVLDEQLARLQSWRDDGIEKPIIVHCRRAVNDLLAVFREAPFEPSRYVFHCFTEGPDAARQVLDFGAWISFTGVVTFRNAPEVSESAKIVPLDRIMVETDSPFLSPEPVRNVRPNVPKHVVHTARRIAELRGLDPVEFERRLDENAERFFGMELPRLPKKPDLHL